MSEKKKKKSGSIAIPFLVTIFIGMILIGGAVFFIYNMFIKDKDSKIKEPQPRNGSISVSADDNHTILMILDDPSAGKASSTFMLMRSMPYKKKMLLIGIPANSIRYSAEQGGQQILKDTYERSGALAAKEFIEDAIGVEIGKYIVFTPESFSRTCEIFGGANYPIDIEFNGFPGDGSVQTLGAEDIRKYITYNKFTGGESERSFKSASVISYMINGSDGDRIAANFDRYFTEIINMTTITDITATDYDKYKDAIKYMFNYGSSISIAIIIDGEQTGKDFIIGSNFIKNLPKEYFGVEEE
jgi:anionic cell wall polymer biosynthesis LytR-Cps2A-Psr (LCP) family protein